MLAKPTSWDGLQFGHNFTDHMLTIKYHLNSGWEAPKISKFRNLELHPASKVLHYAIELFEGMKAYRGDDGHIRIFRPELNMQRMNRSATRACLPNFDDEEFIQCIIRLIQVDQEWVPYSSTGALYIRPTFIGTDPHLGINQSHDALLFVILCPVSSYFDTGFQPVSLYADPRFVRTWEGGVGSCKMGSNYAPTIMINKIAKEFGCQQALWLYGKDEYITEAGTMNIFAVWINDQNELELVTPPLTEGIILPGVTRQSLLEVAKDWDDIKVTEVDFTIHDIRSAVAEERLLEMFGSGTACVICPIRNILYKINEDEEEEIPVPTMEQEKPVFMRLYDAILDIQVAYNFSMDGLLGPVGCELSSEHQHSQIEETKVHTK